MGLSFRDIMCGIPSPQGRCIRPVGHSGDHGFEERVEGTAAVGVADLLAEVARLRDALEKTRTAVRPEDYHGSKSCPECGSVEYHCASCCPL